MKKFELPIGFATALAMNEEAMANFERLDESQKADVIKKAQNINSKNEMRILVSSISNLKF